MKYKNPFLFALMLTAAILLPACGGNSATAPAPTTISQVSPVESPILATDTPAPKPTATATPITKTLILPSNTPAPEPTATPLPPTNTPAPEPTATPLPATDTPAPEPTATPVPATNTPAPEPTATPVVSTIPAGQGALVMVNCRGDVLNIDILPDQIAVELAPKTAEICFTSPAIYLDPGSYVLEGSIAGVASELDPAISTVPVVAGQITEIRF